MVYTRGKKVSYLGVMFFCLELWVTRFETCSHTVFDSRWLKDTGCYPVFISFVYDLKNFNKWNKLKCTYMANWACTEDCTLKRLISMCSLVLQMVPPDVISYQCHLTVSCQLLKQRMLAVLLSSVDNLSYFFFWGSLLSHPQSK